MNLQELYKLVVQIGKEQEPGGDKSWQSVLELENGIYDSHGRPERYDTNKLWNPYDDCRILSGDQDSDVTGFLSGVDVDPYSISHYGASKELDTIFYHHPAGGLDFTRCGRMKKFDLMHVGVSEATAQKNTNDFWKMKGNSSPFSGASSMYSKNMEMPMLVCHTPCDNFATNYIHKIIAQNSPSTVGECIEVLKANIPMYGLGSEYNDVPYLTLGQMNSPINNFFVDFTHGIGLTPEMASSLVDEAGVNLFVVGYPHGERFIAREKGASIITIGHFPSDSLGVNLMIEEVKKRMPDTNINNVGSSHYVSDEEIAKGIFSPVIEKGFNIPLSQYAMSDIIKILRNNKFDIESDTLDFLVHSQKYKVGEAMVQAINDDDWRTFTSVVREKAEEHKADAEGYGVEVEYESRRQQYWQMYKPELKDLPDEEDDTIIKQTLSKKDYKKFMEILVSDFKTVINRLGIRHYFRGAPLKTWAVDILNCDSLDDLREIGADVVNNIADNMAYKKGVVATEENYKEILDKKVMPSLKEIWLVLNDTMASFNAKNTVNNHNISKNDFYLDDVDNQIIEDQADDFDEESNEQYEQYLKDIKD